MYNFTIHNKERKFENPDRAWHNIGSNNGTSWGGTIYLNDQWQTEECLKHVCVASELACEILLMDMANISC